MNPSQPPPFSRDKSLVLLFSLKNIPESDLALFRRDAPFFLASHIGQPNACLFYIGGNLPQEQCIATLQAFGFSDVFCRYYSFCMLADFWFFGFYPEGHPLLNPEVGPGSGNIISMAAEGSDGLLIVRQAQPLVAPSSPTRKWEIEFTFGEIVKLFEYSSPGRGKNKRLAESFREMALRLREIADRIDQSESRSDP
jgi:hypothetical protein